MNKVELLLFFSILKKYPEKYLTVAIVHRFKIQELAPY